MRNRIDLERRHDAIVLAVQEAIHILRAPFGEYDEIPGTIQDAIDRLERGLKVMT